VNTKNTERHTHRDKYTERMRDKHIHTDRHTHTQRQKEKGMTEDEMVGWHH